MTSITASALVGMCGQLFAYNKDEAYLFFRRLGESDYIFLFNLTTVSSMSLIDYLSNNPLPDDSFLYFNFEVMENDMEILKNIGQERMPNGYQQLFDLLLLHEGDRIGGCVIGCDSIDEFIDVLQNL